MKFTNMEKFISSRRKVPTRKGQVIPFVAVTYWKPFYKFESKGLRDLIKNSSKQFHERPNRFNPYVSMVDRYNDVLDALQTLEVASARQISEFTGLPLSSIHNVIKYDRDKFLNSISMIRKGTTPVYTFLGM